MKKERFIVMCVTVVDKNIYLSLLVLLLCLCDDAFPKNPYKTGEVRADSPKGCAYLKCKREDQCVSRKFWCKNPPCPSMLYCSKSRKESLKGPSTCEDVRCSRGFICLVRVRYCRWGEACEQQIARCVSERDYYEGPASCVDYRCPSGHRCILRESLCAKPPCKLLKSCAKTKDVKIWLEGCKNLGCLSEHECFLRRPDRDCPNSTCKHTPDCSAKNEEELESREFCRGWVCPKAQECSSHTKGPCKRNSCKISRSCHKPLITPVDVTSPSSYAWKEDIKPRGPLENIKNSTNMEDRKFTPTYKTLSNSRPSLPTPGMTSGRFAKPTLTSLSTWLNHLKLMTGVHAVEDWIEKADKQENYGEFREWLESVKDMLGTAAYDLWLEEVRAMTVTNLAFQKWLPSKPTNRTTNAYQPVKASGNFGVAKTVESSVSQNSSRYQANQAKNDFQLGDTRETLKIKSNAFKEDNYKFPPTNDLPIKGPLNVPDNSMLDKSRISPIPTTMGINQWSQLYPTDPRIFQQVYPSTQHFGNSGPWGYQDIPYQGFDNTGVSHPSTGEFQANWSFHQQPRDNIPDFLRNKAWLDRLFPPAYPQWQRTTDPRQEFYVDRQSPESKKIPEEFHRRFGEDPAKVHSRNATSEDTSWMKYLVDPYVASGFVSSENFGSYPMFGENLGYPSWPSSSYQKQSFADVPHRRPKHEGSSLDPRDSRNKEENERWPREKLRLTSDVSSFRHSGFPWNSIDPRVYEYYLHLADYNRRNLYEKNNGDRSAISPSLSRPHRIDSDPLLSTPNRYFMDNQRQISRPEYHSWSFYPHDRLYGISGTLPSSVPATVVRESDRRIDAIPDLKSHQVDDEGAREFVPGERLNDVPGQTMGLPNLWNSRYRNPSSSVLRKIARKQIGTPDEITRIGPTTTTTSPPITTTTSLIAAPPASQITRDNFQYDTKRSSENDERRFEDYSLQEDDGIYPLLLSLRGYIETPLRHVFQDSFDISENFTILPLYTIDSNVPSEEDYEDYYMIPVEGSDPRERNMNLFQNENYENGTRESAMGIKDDEDSTKNGEEDPWNFSDQTQSYVASIDGLLNNDPSRGGIGNASETWNKVGTQSDYYDERVDYGDEAVRADRSYFNIEPIKDDGSLDHRQTPGDYNDNLYDDSEHKRFKKNRPL